FKGTSPNSTVVVALDISGRDLRMNASDKLVMSYAAVDAQGKIRSGTTDAMTLTLKPETKARVEQNGIRLLKRLDLPVGRYQLRVAVHDSGGGKVGAILYDLEVPDFNKGPLTMSGLALASAWSSGAVVAQADEQIRALLQIPPTAARTFPQNDEL